MTEPMPQQPFQALAALQELDREVHQLRHRRGNLPEATALKELLDAESSAASSAAEVETARLVLVERQVELENAIGRQTKRFHDLERQMQAATNAAPRDLEAMDHELHQVLEHRSRLEDEELALMEEMEPLEQALETAHQAHLSRAEEMAALRVVGSAIVAEIDGTLEERRVTREGLVGAIPEALLSKYEAIKVKVGPIGAARLIGHRCDGCSLDLPAVEVDRISKLGVEEVVTCENCGRILLRASQLA